MIGIYCNSGKTLKFVHRIEQNERIPFLCFVTITTSRKNQTSMMLKVFNCQNSECYILTDEFDEFEITDIPPAPSGAKINICFEINYDGFLIVRGEGNDDIKIKNKMCRLSNDEIERMVAESKKYKEDDDVQRNNRKGHESSLGSNESALISVGIKKKNLKNEEKKSYP